MRRFSNLPHHLRLRLGPITYLLGPAWLVVLPVGAWAITSLYLPILGGPLTALETWTTTLVIGALVAAALLGHVYAHALALRWQGKQPAPDVPLYMFGEAAQVWPAAPLAGGAALVALAGPLFNLALAGLAYLVWNTQLNPVLNLSTLFGCLFSAWLALVNLIPADPFDGGRLLQLFVSSLLDRPALGPRLPRYAGLTGVCLLFVWGLCLAAQRARFSAATCAATLLFAALMAAGLAVPPSPPANAPGAASRSRWRQTVRAALAAFLILLQLLLAFGLTLTNDGLEAPGVALAVEPMVSVPSQYLHPHAGTFILTSVLFQAPITAGEWLIGQFDPAVHIVPPEIIVPANTTPQQAAREGFIMLDQSELTAIAVGLRLAGYTVDVSNAGAEIVGVQPDSLASGLLQPGDVIVAVEGSPTASPEALINQLQKLGSQTTVRLSIKRNGQVENLSVALLPAAAPGGSPRLGIVIQAPSFQVHLPFAVAITPQKIVGGPSAGLMFALTVCNLLSPTDLAAGRRVAGTGTINLDGTVGPIGGVGQKVAAAEAAGASYFLSPAENYDEARAAAQHIQVIRVATIGQAVDFLHTLGPSSDGGSCAGAHAAS